MLKILDLKDGGAILARTFADQQMVFGPVFADSSEAAAFAMWLSKRGLNVESDLSERGISYFVTLFREERAAKGAA